MATWGVLRKNWAFQARVRVERLSLAAAWALLTVYLRQFASGSSPLHTLFIYAA